MEFLRIVLFCVASAIVYGIVHDQITARICVEYFTIGHPPIYNITDPTLLGLIWGVLATWWAGAFLGFCIASAARLGSWPKRSFRSVIRPVAILLCVMGIGAVAAGIVGNALAKSGAFTMPSHWADSVPQAKHIPFITDLWAHNASYLVGFLGAIILSGLLLLGRRKEKSEGIMNEG